MRIRILTPGKTKAAFIVAGSGEYLKRLQSYAKVEVVTLSEVKVPPGPSPAEIEAVKNAEAKIISKSLRPGEYTIALTEKGRQFTSLELAGFFHQLANRGQSRLAFIIGGPLGLSLSLLEKSQTKLSLSSLTFTHELARLLLLEQLYRSFKINAGEPYHY